VAVALTGLSAVIALAARAPLSHLTAIDARSAATPVTALWLLAIGAGIVGLTGLVVLVWPGRRRPGDDEPGFESQEPQIHWLGKLAAIALPFALGAALLAAVVVGLQTGGRAVVSPAGRPPVARLTVPPPTLGNAGAGRHGFTVPAWLPWTVLGIVVATLAVGAILVWRWWRVPATIAAPDPVPATAAVRAAMTALDTVEDPREAVIGAYAAMQETLAAHGVPRSSAETPREYLQRVLLASAAAEAEARTLTGLFEEARFSIHPISEGIRQRALAALSAVGAKLRPARTP
jgi:hypothetical protein